MSESNAEADTVPFPDGAGTDPCLANGDEAASSEAASMEVVSTEAAAMVDVGLDMGCESVRSIRRGSAGLNCRRQATAYTILDDRPAHRSVLTAAGVRFSECSTSLIVIGDAAVEVGASFSVPVIPALPEGRLPTSDPVGRQVVALLIDAVLPQGNGVCAVCLPKQREPDDLLERYVGNLVRLRGYRALVTGGAAAAGLTLLDQSGLTGLIVDAGASGVSLSLLLRGREMQNEVIPIGYEAIASGLCEQTSRVFFDRAGNRYRDTVAVRESLQSADLELLRPRTREEHLVAGALREVAELAGVAAARLLSGRGLPQPDPPAVITGGLLRLRGFSEILSNAFTAAGVTEVIIHDAADGLTVSRGLLTLAESESPRLAA